MHKYCIKSSEGAAQNLIIWLGLKTTNLKMKKTKVGLVEFTRPPSIEHPQYIVVLRVRKGQALTRKRNARNKKDIMSWFCCIDFEPSFIYVSSEDSKKEK